MRRLRQLLLALWAGTLLAVGALTAPLLFTLLEDRALAGRVAGECFRRTTLLSVALALAIGVVASAERPPPSRLDRLGPLLPALLLLVATHGLQPLLEAARRAGEGAAFAAWHGISAGLFGLAALAVLALLWRALGPARP